MQKVPEISVVVPSRNRPQAIVACLDALALQTLPKNSFEVVVVDDGSEPALRLDSRQWDSKYELRLIHQENMGPAGARNRGVLEARGAFVAFTDDDCLPTPTWLDRIIAELRRHPGAMVGGSTFNGLREDIFAETNQLIIDLVYEHFNREPAKAYFLASNNFALGRDLYLSCGGFDLEFAVPGAEDREFCDRWRMQGRPIRWCKDAFIEHRHGQGLLRFLGLHIRYGRGAYLYQHKRRNRRSGTMAEDLEFHRMLPIAALQKLSRLGPLTSVRLLFNLFLWQIANAAGFVWERYRWHSSGRKMRFSGRGSSRAD